MACLFKLAQCCWYQWNVYGSYFFFLAWEFCLLPGFFSNLVWSWLGFYFIFLPASQFLQRGVSSLSETELPKKSATAMTFCGKSVWMYSHRKWIQTVLVEKEVTFSNSKWFMALNFALYTQFVHQNMHSSKFWQLTSCLDYYKQTGW